MMPKLTLIDKLYGIFYWWCLRKLNLEMEDVERTRLYSEDPTTYRRILDYFYYRQAKKDRYEE